MDMTALLGFTFGPLGSVRDQQEATPEDLASYAPPHVPAPEVHMVGTYAADYSPLSPGDLIDEAVDGELAELLAASTVVRRNASV